MSDFSGAGVEEPREIPSSPVRFVERVGPTPDGGVGVA